AGGKRERGLLFLGAPGTGKTMLAKAIATNFNCPFVTIPGSGFAATFIGIDVIVVMFLIRKAKKLARKWGGQCIVFIDEIDAVGMRRQALQGSRKSVGEPELPFYGPYGAINPSGDLIVETRAWRDQMFEQRAPEPASPYPPAPERRPDLLHRRDERPDGRPRPRPDAPRPDGPSRVVPDADEGRPGGHLRPLPRQGRARGGSRHARPPRRDRTDHERLLAGDDRADLLDGADERPPRGEGPVLLDAPRRRDDRDRVGHGDRHPVRRARDARDRDP